MNVALWIVTGLLAFVLLGSGGFKLFLPKGRLLAMAATAGGGAGSAAAGWLEDFSPRAIKSIAAIELLGAAGLILPAVLNIAPVLVPLAATGTVFLFVGAVMMRLRRGEKATIVPDLVYLAMAAFVAFGRLGPAALNR